MRMNQCCSLRASQMMSYTPEAVTRAVNYAGVGFRLLNEVGTYQLQGLNCF